LNDPGTPVDETDTTLLAQFAAAISMAQTAIAALDGNAPYVKVLISGYRDLNTAAPSAFGAAGSKIRVEYDEYWQI
jgi:hypothetical protein